MVGLYAAGILLGSITVLAALQLDRNGSLVTSLAKPSTPNPVPAIVALRTPDPRILAGPAMEPRAQPDGESMPSAAGEPPTAAVRLELADEPAILLSAPLLPAGVGDEERRMTPPSAEPRSPEIECMADVSIPFAINSSMPHLAPNDTGIGIIGGWLEKHPDERLVIEGHTDASGNPDNNMVLSFRRAAAVKAELIRRGIRRDLMEIAALGDLRPKDGVRATSADNRRVLVRQKNREGCDAHEKPMVTRR